MSSNRLIYDNCAFNQQLHDSVTPLTYKLYLGRYQNAKKCQADKNVMENMGQRVDLESVLRNQDRYNSKCNEHKYTPICHDPSQCKNAFKRNYPPYPCDNIRVPANKKVADKSHVSGVSK